MSICTSAALSVVNIIVYCVVAASSAAYAIMFWIVAALSTRICCYDLMVMTLYEIDPLYIYIYIYGVGFSLI